MNTRTEPLCVCAASPADHWKFTPDVSRHLDGEAAAGVGGHLYPTSDLAVNERIDESLRGSDLGLGGLRRELGARDRARQHVE